jgi:pre-60S factor REI1
MSVLTCYTAPGVVFETEAAMKEHYKSEWHRHNLKRKVAGLAPLNRDAFEQRAASAAVASAANGGGTSFAATGCSSLGGSSAPLTRSAERRLKREAKQNEKAAREANNPNSKTAHFEATKKMSEHEYIEHKMATAEPFDEGSDLFSRHHCSTMEENLAHMARTHGFYVPYMDYVTDLRGLLGYLLEMVYVGNVALVSGKQFHTLEAVQAHMRATGGCRMELEGHEEVRRRSVAPPHAQLCGWTPCVRARGCARVLRAGVARGCCARLLREAARSGARLCADVTQNASRLPDAARGCALM